MYDSITPLLPSAWAHCICDTDPAMHDSRRMTVAHADVDMHSHRQWHLLRCKPYSWWFVTFLLDLMLRSCLLTLMRCKAKSSSKAGSCSNACQGCCAECDATLMACSSTYLPLLRVKASSSTCMYTCQFTHTHMQLHFHGTAKAVSRQAQCTFKEL